MSNELEKELKRWLKRKVSITMSMIVIFAITGSVGFAALRTNFSEGEFRKNHFQGALVNSINTTNKEVNRLATEVEKLDKRVKTEEGKLGELEEKVTTELGRIADLDKRVTTLEVKSTDLGNVVYKDKENTFTEKNTFEKGIDVNGNSSISSGLSSVEVNKAGVSTKGLTITELAGAKTSIAGVQTNVAGIQTNLAGVQTDISGVKTDLAGTRTEGTLGNSTETVGGAKKETYGTQTTTVETNKTETIKGNSTETVKGKKVENYEAGLETNVTGDSTETITDGNKLTKVNKDFTITTEVEDGAKLVMDKDKNQFSKDVYIGSDADLAKNLQLADIDAIQIGKAAVIKGVLVKNVADAKGNNTAIGYANKAAGQRSLSTGFNNTANGIESVAIGANNIVKGNYSTAVGNNNEVTGNSSTTVGTRNIIKGNNSGAFGDPNVITGNGSYAVGNNNTIAGDGNFVLGSNVNIGAGVKNSVALGENSLVLGSDEVSVEAPGKERKITNIGDGVIGPNSTDAVTGKQAYGLKSSLQKEIHHVGSLSAALSALNPMQYDPKAPNQIMAALGHYRDRQAVAVGLSHHFSNSAMMTAGLAIGNDTRTKTMANLGFTARLGKGGDATVETPQSVVQSEMARLSKENSQLKSQVDTQATENKDLKDRVQKLEEALETLLKK